MQPLRAGALRDWPPYHELDDEGAPAGFAVETLDAVAERAGRTVDYRLFDDFASMNQALRDGDIDLIPTMGILDERRDDFDFSQPLETFEIVLFVRRETSNVSSLDDLTGRRVGVITTNVGERIVRDEDVQAIHYDDLRTAIYELLAGRIDGLIYPRSIVEVLAHRAELDTEIQAVGPSLGEVKRGMAARTGDPILERLEPAIEAFLRSEDYAEARARWLQPPPSFWTASSVGAIAGCSLLLLIAAFVWLRARWRRRHERAVERSEDAERERRASQGRVRKLLDQASDGVFLADPSGYFTEVNRRGCEMTGFGRDELLGMHLARLFAPGELERQPLGLDDLRTGEVVLADRIFQRKDGSTFPVEISATVLEDGQYQGIVRDVSERHASEQALREKDAQLQQAQKLEAIGRLAGGVAHDFNNLLTVVVGNGALLQATLEGEEREAIDDIMDAGSRATELTRQLLAYSRREVIEREVFDIRSVLEGVRRMLERVIGEDVALVVETPAEPCLLDGSKVHLEQVLLNLAVNARDAMPSGGSLEIHCAIEDDAADGEWMVLRVTDTGHGMDEETLAHIFEPFYTTKDVGTGTGLGLAMVHSLAEQMGGSVEVESAPDEGATFLIRLPRASATPSAEPLVSEDRTSVEPAGARILVVEDEDAVRRLVVQALDRAGFEVAAAANAEEALERVSQGFAPDLLLTDVVMPGLGGVELAEAMAEQRPSLPTLFMSGYTDRSLDAVLTDARRSFLAKPFAPRQLLGRVRELLLASEESLGSRD